MGMALCHLLQMTPRMGYDALLWRNTQSMYRFFGASLGAYIEVGAVLMSLGLLYFLRERRTAFQWAFVCAGCMFIAHLAWWVFVYPVNKQMVHWTLDSIPKNWYLFRLQWEYTHAVRAIFEIAGFAAVVISILVEIPRKAGGTAPG